MFENLSSRRMFWLESQKTVKMIMFVINRRRFTCGVVEDRFKSLSGSKQIRPLKAHDFDLNNAGAAL
jgi:hypothetical protein